ncbi:hypothetical protein PCASD_24149 [Puccinia coronata f. sp. avenae]|uniref:Tafazzin family protein n=1 Tax=Puccinia coronata f. sp. avenae TaxID=200324 RepID=A0A2N5S062_9BASI|nr:hypothetical protein PCASD_24149 [Puccinia coronata f. sp. avenae]
MSVYIASVMSVFKPLLYYGMRDARVDGLPILLDLLDRRPDPKRGLITISNHISTLDDPMVWGMMPFRTYLDTTKARWTLGAADILFTNRWIAPLFQNGQVIKTVRGDGIYQPAMDLALEKLNHAQWLHVFPEGRVNQSALDPSQPAQELLRFKWGISRLVLESTHEPIIVPIWLKGFDHVMPEGRRAPWKMMPRLNQRLAVTISGPINNPSVSHSSDDAMSQNQLHIRDFRTRYRALLSRPDSSSGPVDYHEYTCLKDHAEAKQIRMDLASFLRSRLLASRPPS